jgi:hypothetical protein
LLLGVALTIAIGSTLLPSSKSADPLQVDIYVGQVTPVLEQVQTAFPALHAASGGDHSTAGAAAATLPALRACARALAAMGVPEGVGGAHRQLRQACDAYVGAGEAAEAWAGDSKTGSGPLLRLKIRLSTADKLWAKAAVSLRRLSGRDVVPIPESPGSSPRESPGGGNDGGGGPPVSGNT